MFVFWVLNAEGLKCVVEELAESVHLKKQFCNAFSNVACRLHGFQVTLKLCNKAWGLRNSLGVENRILYRNRSGTCSTTEELST